MFIAILFGTTTLFNSYIDNIIPIAIITIIALFLGYFYTAPPIRLVARNGLGEIFNIYCIWTSNGFRYWFCNF